MRKAFRGFIRFLTCCSLILGSNAATAYFLGEPAYWYATFNGRESGFHRTPEATCDDLLGVVIRTKGVTDEHPYRPWRSAYFQNGPDNPVCYIVDNTTKDDHGGSWGPVNPVYECPENTVSKLTAGTCECKPDFVESSGRCVLMSMENMCEVGGYFGNPISPASAEKIRMEADWEGAGLDALSFKRIYRSYLGGSPSGAGRSMGPGWGHSHHMILQKKKNGSNTIAITDANGEVLIFKRENEVSIWRAVDSLDNVAESGGGWIYTRVDDGISFHFDPDGRLVRRIKRNGWKWEYSYQDGHLVRVRNDFGQDLKLSYVGEKLASVEVPDGGIYSYEYDSEERLIKVKYPGGAHRSFVYENPVFSFALTGILDEMGQRWASFSYDTEGKAITTELAGGVERYSVSYSPGRIADVVDPLGTRRRYRYFVAKNNRIHTSSSSLPVAGASDDFAVRSVGYDGILSSVRDFVGHARSFDWDKERRLLRSAWDSVGQTSFEWHSRFNLPTKIVRDAKEISYHYDENGNVKSETTTDNSFSPPLSSTWKWTYHPFGAVSTVEDPEGAVSRFSYDEFGNVSSAINRLGQAEEFIYDKAGRVLIHTLPTGLISIYNYDERGRVTRVKRGDQVTSYAYQSTGKMDSVLMDGGYKISYQYDAAHRLIGWSDNRGVTANYLLDAMGNRVEENIFDDVGHVAWKSVRTINRLNLVESITNGDAGVRFGYDENGELTSSVRQVNGVSQGTSWTLDALRRMDSVKQADGATASLSYNDLSAVTSISDFNKSTTRYARNVHGHAIKEVSADGGTVSAVYDGRGQARNITDAAGRTLAVQRDALGRPTQLQYGSTATSTLRYDLPGTTYNGPGAPKASTGHLSEIQDPGVTTQYQRDILGRVLRKSQILANGDTKSLIHSYVPAGQGGGGELQSITYPSGRQATYLYDSTGQITGLQWNGQPLVTGLTWSPLGQPTAWQWTGFAQQPGATATLAEQRSYNTAGQLASSQLLNLTWDAAGRISLIQQQHMLPGTAAAQQAKLSSAFSYDAVGRLTASAHSAPAGLTLPTGWSLADTIELSASGYAWDANGNRTQVHYNNALASGTSTLQRSYQTAAGTNRLQSYAQTLQRPGSAAQNSNVTFSYDAAGALVKKGDNHLHYGADGRIAKAGEYADAADARAVSYVYNALGQRVLKSDARGAGQPATLQTLYAEDGIGSTVLGQYANQRSANSAAPAGQSDSTEIIYLPTASGPMPIAAEINGRLYAIHTDHLNTPRRLTNQQGQVAWQWLISGFGEVRPTTGDRGYGQTVSGPSYAQAVKFDLRYPGQVFDEETGLSYNLHRYYDAATGRYMQADPIGLEGGWNRFGYVGGNPLIYGDPQGLFKVMWQGESFATTPPPWVKQLREYGRKLEDKIDSLCSSDSSYLKSYFDKWTVGTDGRRGSPTTDVDNFHTNFTSDYFGLTSNFINPFEKSREDPYAVFLHEFRHLMKGNRILSPSGSEYLKHRLNGTTGGLAVEIDADSYALELFKGKCTCGSMRR